MRAEAALGACCGGAIDMGCGAAGAQAVNAPVGVMQAPGGYGCAYVYMLESADCMNTIPVGAPAAYEYMILKQITIKQNKTNKNN